MTTRGERRRFGLTVGSAFVVLTLVAAWRGRRVSAEALGTIGAALALAAVAVPERLGAVQRAWMATAHAMSRVTTPLFMGVVYFGVLTPIGVASRGLGRRRGRRGASALVRRPPGARRSDLRRQF